MSELPAARRAREKREAEQRENAAPEDSPPTTRKARPDQAAIDALAGSNSEAARLLTKLYGRKKATVVVPKPRTRHRPHDSAFIPGGGKPDVDPRKATTATGEVAVPKVGQPRRRHFAPIEFRSGRGVKTKDTIDADLAEAERMADRGMPPLRPQLGEGEKRKLATVFQFKGGKALPEEMTLAPIEGHIPLSLMTSGKKKAIPRRNNRQPAAAPPPARHELQSEFDEISAEIVERQEFLAELRSLGKAKDHEGYLLAEIADRTKELDALAARMGV